MGRPSIVLKQFFILIPSWARSETEKFFLVPKTNSFVIPYGLRIRPKFLTDFKSL